jgi:hypothetical protein
MPSRSASLPARAPAPSAARAAARRSRAAGRPAPERDAAFDALTLEALREYRSALQAEEGKVSYWRRILQARLDLVRAGSATGPAERVDLRPVLTDSRVRSGRTALVEVLPVDDIPPLPSLAELWERRVAPSDLVASAALEADLEQAEEQLSSYRTALHERIGGATGELIARYREEPTLCLSVLPQRPARSVTSR